ncbi:MAG: hypothetical protein EZS28_024551, partial [Streblomastix strix]
DPHQVRQLYRSIRFSKAKSRGNISSGGEENSYAMSTTENTNTDSTYSGNIEQDNRRTKYVRYPGRLFSKGRSIHSPVSSVGDNTKSGLVHNRGKQTRGYIRGNRRGRGRGEWLNAFSRPWKEEIFWIHPPIPKIGKALIAWEKFKPKSIMIAPWRPGQIWFTSLLTDCCRYLILGESSLILNPGKEMMKKKDMLPPGKIAAFIMDQELIREGGYQQNFQITQT